MATYWHIHERGFANECGIARCEDAADAREAAAQGWERLSLPEMRRHVSWVNGENSSWPGTRRIRPTDVQFSEGYRWVFVNLGLGA